MGKSKVYENIGRRSWSFESTSDVWEKDDFDDNHYYVTVNWSGDGSMFILTFDEKFCGLLPDGTKAGRVYIIRKRKD